MKRRARGVTLMCVDCLHYARAAMVMSKCLDECIFDRAVFLSDRSLRVSGVETRVVSRINSKEEYSQFVMKELVHHFNTPHVLLVQHDGFILDGLRWCDHFLAYDYIGATWPGGHPKVGNGGFSLRSRRLHQVLADDPEIVECHPEDSRIGRTMRQYLETTYGIKYAPPDVARLFSHEHDPERRTTETFGFHAQNYEVPPPFVRHNGSFRSNVEREINL